MEYIHDPLPPGDFLRILTIEYHGINNEPVVDFELRSLHDDAPLAYTAISYAWEDHAPVRRVFSKDGRYISLSATLSAFFDSQRSFCRIWVDALCIDQSRVAERNHQVNLMGQIYSKADRVLIWLGPGDELARRALGMLESGQPVKLHHKNVRKAVLRLLRCPWFTRVWVIQEALVNTTVLMSCGDCVIQFQSFADAEGTVLNLGNYTQNFKSSDPSYRGINCARQIVIMRWQYQEHGHVPLTFLLQAVHQFLASDPRDFIFAIRAIAQSADLLPEADYAKTEEEVFQLAASSILCSGRYVDLLALCGLGPRELGMQLTDSNSVTIKTGTSPKLPSWVPDFRFNSQHEPFGYADIASWNAGGPYLGEVTVSGHELHLRGQLIDYISEVGAVIRSWNSDSMCEVLEKAVEIASTRMNFGRTTVGEKLLLGCGRQTDLPESVLAMIARTLLLGIFNDGNQLEEDHSHFEDVLVDLRQSIELRQVGIDGIGDKLVQRLRLRSDNMKMFGGENGTIGLSKRMTQPDDVVCLFPGCRFPFIIRPNQGRQSLSPTSKPLQGQLIGWCYVDGMMTGEGLNSELKRTFVLT